MQFMAEPTSPPEVATLGRCSGCVTACFMTQQDAMAALGEHGAFHFILEACNIYLFRPINSFRVFDNPEFQSGVSSQEITNFGIILNSKTKSIIL